MNSKENRRFGLIMASAFFVLMGVRAWRSGHIAPAWGVVALLFLAAAALWPAALTPLHRLWLGFGHLMNRLTQPLILGLVYFLVLTPFGLWRRLRGHSKIQLVVPESSAWTTPPAQESSDERLTRQYS